MPMAEPLDPFILVIFGATGDLTHRKLYPAVFQLHQEGLLPKNTAVVGVGRRPKTTEEVRRNVAQSIGDFARTKASREQIDQQFLSKFHYFRMDFSSEEGFPALKEFLEELDQKVGSSGNRIFFLAVAPEHFRGITRAIGKFAMAPNFGSWQRLVIEKPFGRDLPSAVQLNEAIQETFAERNIYRIDHYLGKEMAQNLMVIRFANTLFEPLWNSRYIDHVQISLCETGGVENRGPYYEQAGALRDMVQNHMMQLLSLTAMEPPVSLDTESIRDEKVKVLRSIHIDPKDVVRGQYGPGTFGGRRVPGYRQEDRVPEDSNIETFVALKATIDNFRWSGVPFYLRTGKRLPEKYSEILIKFRELPGVLYFRDKQLDSNLLVIRVQPDEGVYLKFNAKQPGAGQNIVPVTMDFCQNCREGLNSPEAYERLLLDVIRGDSTLFTRWDEVENSWRLVDRIAQAWQSENSQVSIYEPGTWGPPQADWLLAADQRKWLYLRRE